MDLPTYTNIWRIEKRLYKLYDLRLPMPLPIVWIGVFVGVLAPWSLLLWAVGIQFHAPWHVLYLVPPGIVTWLSTRPVIESKRLTELMQSQLRYVGEPRTWCRMAPTAEPETVSFSGRVWRAMPETVRVKQPRKARQTQRKRHAGQPAGPRAVRPAVAAAAAAAVRAPVAEPAAVLPARAAPVRRRGTAPALTARPAAVPLNETPLVSRTEEAARVVARGEAAASGRVAEGARGVERAPEVSRWAGRGDEVLRKTGSGVVRGLPAVPGGAQAEPPAEPPAEGRKPAESREAGDAREVRPPAAGKPIDTEALRRLRRLAASADVPPSGASGPEGERTSAEVGERAPADEVARDMHRKGQPPRHTAPPPLPGQQRGWPLINPDAKPVRLVRPVLGERAAKPEITPAASAMPAVEAPPTTAEHREADISPVEAGAAATAGSVPRTNETKPPSRDAGEPATCHETETSAVAPHEALEAPAASPEAEESVAASPAALEALTASPEVMRSGATSRGVQEAPAASPEVKRSGAPSRDVREAPAASPEVEGSGAGSRDVPEAPTASPGSVAASRDVRDVPAAKAVPGVPAAGAGDDAADEAGRVVVPGPRGGEREGRVRRVESVVGRDSGGWRRIAQVVVGGGGVRTDGSEIDEARARAVFSGSRRVVVLGCTGGAGQSTTALMLGHTLAQQRDDRVVAVDASTGGNTLTSRVLPETPETLTSLLSGLDQVSGYLGMRGYTTRTPSGLEVIGADADADAEQRLTDRTLLSDHRLGQAVHLLDRHYKLTVIDPAAALAARVLPYADQIVLVVPASEEAPEAVAMTYEWLDGHGCADLRRRAVMVVNGVSRRSMGDVEQAESVARGRCRAIVRVPWEDDLAPGGQIVEPGRLRAPGRRAYLALAGVVVAGFSAQIIRPSEEELASDPPGTRIGER